MFMLPFGAPVKDENLLKLQKGSTHGSCRDPTKNHNMILVPYSRESLVPASNDIPQRYFKLTLAFL